MKGKTTMDKKELLKKRIQDHRESLAQLERELAQLEREEPEKTDRDGD